MTDYLRFARAAEARGQTLLANAYRRVAADPPFRKSDQPQPKVTPLISRRSQPTTVHKDEADSIAEQLAAIATRVGARSESAPASAAPAARPPAPEDPTALARQHLSQLAAASAARVGRMDSGAVTPGSANDKLRAGGGTTLRGVIARASDNTPGNGGVRWADE